MTNTKLKAFLVFAILMFGPFVQSYADSIQGEKKGRVLITTDSPNSLNIGDKVFATDAGGAKKALIEIDRVKGTKAFGVVKKGKVSKGMNIVKGNASGSSSKRQKVSRSNRSSESASGKSLPFTIGALLGLGLDSMQVKLTDAAGNAVETLNMSGTGFSIKGMADYNLTSYLGLRVLAGLENFTVQASAASAVCDGSTACQTDISFITFDGWLRYAFIDTGTKFWIGAGMGLWMPASKSTNALDETSIDTSYAIYLGGGADIPGGEDIYIPVQAEYTMLPSSTQVTASTIAIRAGIGYRF